MTVIYVYTQLIFIRYLTMQAVAEIQKQASMLLFFDTLTALNLMYFKCLPAVDTATVLKVYVHARETLLNQNKGSAVFYTDALPVIHAFSVVLCFIHTMTP